MLGAGLWYGLLGAVGAVSRGVLLPVAAVGYALCLIWHARRRDSVSFSRRSIQANRALVRGTRGRAYFGALLGTGIFTEAATPLVWAGALYSLAAGFPGGLLYGAGFGLGRSTPALSAILFARRDIDHGAIAELIVIRLRPPLRYAAFLAALSCVCIAMVSAWPIL
jgi:hypothetical protein